MKRLFIAVDPNSSVAAQLEKTVAELKPRVKALLPRAEARWYSREHFHLTLKFLGSVADEAIDPICAAVDSAVEGLAPFQLTARGLGAFPGLSCPRVVWAGIDDSNGILQDLAKRVDLATQPLGFPGEEREFEPHFTLARLKDASQAQRLFEKAAEERFGTFQVEEVILYESKLRAGPEGQSRYFPIRKIRLGRG